LAVVVLLLTAGFFDAAGLVFDGRFGDLAIGIVSVTYMVARLIDSDKPATQSTRTIPRPVDLRPDWSGTRSKR
jgi:hypothetical protein